MASILEFDSLGALAIHARQVQRRFDQGITRGMEVASRRLLQEVHRMFGTYQTGAGPFPDWQELSDSALTHHAAYGRGDTPLLLSGDLAASYRMQKFGNEVVIGSDSPYALIHEIGGYTKNSYIPPRSTLGIAFVRAEKSMWEKYQRELEYVLEGRGEMLGLRAIMDRNLDVREEETL